MHFKADNFIEVLPKESLVYLSGDSKNTVEKLENGVNYIIGGLVDHNNHKGICLKKAEELGIKHARLPIDEYINMKTRHVLAVNHVYEILTQCTQNKSWKDAFLTTIPNRKGVEEKEDVKEDKKEYIKEDMKEDVKDVKEDVENVKEDVKNGVNCD